MGWWNLLKCGSIRGFVGTCTFSGVVLLTSCAPAPLVQSFPPAGKNQAQFNSEYDYCDGKARSVLPQHRTDEFVACMHAIGNDVRLANGSTIPGDSQYSQQAPQRYTQAPQQYLEPANRSSEPDYASGYPVAAIPENQVSTTVPRVTSPSSPATPNEGPDLGRIVPSSQEVVTALTTAARDAFLSCGQQRYITGEIDDLRPCLVKATIANAAANISLTVITNEVCRRPDYLRAAFTAPVLDFAVWFLGCTGQPPSTVPANADPAPLDLTPSRTYGY